ncbi:MAG: response regulator [Stenotrophomonas maltophilia]
MDGLAELLTSVSTLLGAVAWPIATFLIAFIFRSSIRQLLDNVGELSFKAPGVEASAKKIQLAAAIAAEELAVKGGESAALAARNATNVVQNSLTDSVLKKARSKRVLWVDDEPQNNRGPLDLLSAIGFDVRTSVSTDEAVGLLNREGFDLVISDMGRPPDPMAGYTLLQRIRANGVELPFLIYAAGGDRHDNQEMARRKGAQGSTSRPTRLIEMVIEQIQS